MDFDSALIAETKRELVEKGVQYCFASYVDVHGVPKAKTVPIDYFEKMARGSELFTVGAMDGLGLVGPQQDECAAVPDLSAMTILPWDKRFAWFPSDLYYRGEPYANCPRNMLKRVLAKAAAAKQVFNLGVEAELYVFRKSADRYVPLANTLFLGPTPGYDVNQTMQSLEFLHPMVQYMNALGWGVYSFDQEGGRGQYEFDFAYADALKTCDRMIFLRFMAKQIASSVGAVASFMPKPFSDDFRSGAHFNMSLSDGKSNLFEPKGGSRGTLAERYGIGFPDVAFHFAAGLLAHTGALTALACPTFNSYKGLVSQGDMVDMSWAPVLRCYGRNNRSAMLRLPMNRYCIENRSPDISTNFYLTAAFSLAAGMEGMQTKLDPGPPWNEDLYQLVEGRATTTEPLPERLPRTLIEALDAFKADPLIASTFGPEFQGIYFRQKTKEWEKGYYRVSDDDRRAAMEFI